MKKRTTMVLAAALLCCLVLVSVVLAQASANYRLQRRVLASAGGAMDSANYDLNLTLGQPSAIGPSHSTNFGLYAGYWAGAAALPGLSVQKDVTALVVAPGTPISYTIIVSNSGIGNASGAVVSDTMPAGVTFAGPVTLDPPGAGTVGTPPVLVSGATIAAGGSITVAVPVTVNTCLAVGTVITNTTAVSSTEVPAPVDGSVSITVANARPMLGTVDPSSGSGPTGVTTYFTTTWKDGNCWQDLKQCYFHIGASPSIVGSVTLLYNAAKNRLWLRNDGGTAWTGGYAPGSANVLENSQAIVHCDLTTAQGSGDTLGVTWAIEFKSGYTDTKKLGLKCKDRQKAKAKGRWKGSWTIVQSDLSITHLQYSGPDEYVHIINHGAGPQDMTGWQIHSVVGDQWYSFPPGHTLAAGGYVRVHSGPDAWSSFPTDLKWTTAYRWNDGGDEARLYDSHGSLMDAWSYWPVAVEQWPAQATPATKETRRNQGATQVRDTLKDPVPSVPPW